MAKEIERKFLMNIDIYDYIMDNGKLVAFIDVINQVYLSNNKDIRVRMSQPIKYYITLAGKLSSFRTLGDAKCTLTYKTGNVLERDEYETVIDSLAFDILSELKVNNEIQKTRYTLHTGEEIDIFKERQLCLLEKEFNSKQEADNYNLPDVLAQFVEMEVTDDPAYKNKEIAKWLTV